MRATEPPRRCKCDECAGTYSVLQELDLFSARRLGNEEKDAITVLHSPHRICQALLILGLSGPNARDVQ
jgi:hypothetical protein